jgi:hypothetical protein
MHCYYCYAQRPPSPLANPPQALVRTQPPPAARPLFSKADRSNGIFLLSQITYRRLQARPGLLQTAGTSALQPLR